MKLSFSGLEIDSESRTVQVGGTEVELTKKEFDLALCFALKPRVVLSRERIMNEVWGYDTSRLTQGQLNTVTEHVRRLRNKVGAETIVTRHGGYAWWLTEIEKPKPEFQMHSAKSAARFYLDEASAYAMDIKAVASAFDVAVEDIVPQLVSIFREAEDNDPESKSASSNVCCSQGPARHFS